MYMKASGKVPCVVNALHAIMRTSSLHECDLHSLVAVIAHSAYPLERRCIVNDLLTTWSRSSGQVVSPATRGYASSLIRYLIMLPTSLVRVDLFPQLNVTDGSNAQTPWTCTVLQLARMCSMPWNLDLEMTNTANLSQVVENVTLVKSILSSIHTRSNSIVQTHQHRLAGAA